MRLVVLRDAIYKRMKRGTIPWGKGDDKTYVYVDDIDGSTDSARQATEQAASLSNYVSKDELLSEIRARVRFLEEELQRKDAILLSLTNRIPELESVQEPREAPERVTKTTGNSSDVPPEQDQRRSWLSRFFFGP